MKNTSLFAAISLLLIGAAQAASPSRDAAANYGRLPLSFEPNQGQTDAKVKFMAHGAGYSIYLSPGSATFSLERSDQAAVVRMDLVGANQAAGTEAQGKLPGIANYMVGAKRTTNIPTYAKIRSHDVYPGIDLVYYGTQGQLEYDFVVAPGADPSRIRMTFAGATPAVDASGDLVLPLGGHDIRFRKPVLYQDIEGVRKPVSGRFTIAAKSHDVAFQVDSYNRGRELTIDPVLAYSSYFGGPTYSSQITAMALNAAGDIYLTGWTLDPAFPITPGVFEPTCPYFPSNIVGGTNAYDCKFGAYESGSNGAFVSKISADGQTLLYSTFLGGAATGTNVDNIQIGNDYGTGIAVDSGDNAWVVGTTGSNTFPITPSTAFQQYCDPEAPPTLYTPVFGSYCGTTNNAVFLVQLNPTGTTELYGTFVNGTGWSIGGALISLDGAGDIYVAGTVYNPNPSGFAQFVPFPTTTSAYQFTGLGTNFSAFVTEFAPGGRALIYSTLFGGPNGTAFTVTDGLAVSGGKIYIGGQTNDPQLPTTPGALSSTCVRAQPGDQTCSGNASQGFVAEIDPTESGAASLVFSTYLNGSTLVGGNESSQVFALAADTAGNAYAGGITTYSAADGFPATVGALQPTCALKANSECSTNFVTKLSQTGSLVWSTFYGSPSGANGGNNNGVTAIAVDPSENVYITGGADAQGDLPLNNSLQSYTSGVAFVTELNSSGSQVLFGTFYGGGADIYPTTLALDASSNIYFAGYTAASLPLVNPLQSTNSGGSSQGFFAKIAVTTPQTITFGPLSNVTYGAAPFTVSATASSGLSVSYSVTGPATISGSTLTITGAGHVSVTASRVGNSTYSAASPVTQGFTVAPAVLTVTAASPNVAYGQAIPALTYTLSGFVSPDTAAVVSGAPSESTTATSTSAPGGYPVTIAQGTLSAANYTFNFVNGTLTIAQTAQTITFGVLPNVPYGTAPITLTATASSGLAVSYSVTGPATVSGSKLTITGVGPVTVTASQAGNADYGAATSVRQSFNVTAASQAITFGALPNVPYGTAPITLTATASSGLAVSYTVTGPATVSSSKLIITGVGPVTVTASQAGNADYGAATSVSQSFTVTAASQTITFGAIPAQTVGGSVSLSASATSGLTVSFSSSTTAVCTASGTTAKLLTTGTCSIQASQSGNADYLAAASVTQSFTVSSAAGFTITADPSKETAFRGILAAFLLEIQSVDGFKGDVKLSCSGGPEGAECADLPQTVSVDGTAWAISGILFPASTTPGTYTITFTGTSGSVTASATGQFIVK